MTARMAAAPGPHGDICFTFNQQTADYTFAIYITRVASQRTTQRCADRPMQWRPMPEKKKRITRAKKVAVHNNSHRKGERNHKLVLASISALNCSSTRQISELPSLAHKCNGVKCLKKRRESHAQKKFRFITIVIERAREITGKS